MSGRVDTENVRRAQEEEEKEREEAERRAREEAERLAKLEEIERKKREKEAELEEKRRKEREALLAAPRPAPTEAAPAAAPIGGAFVPSAKRTGGVSFRGALPTSPAVVCMTLAGTTSVLLSPQPWVKRTAVGVAMHLPDLGPRAWQCCKQGMYLPYGAEQLQQLTQRRRPRRQLRLQPQLSARLRLTAQTSGDRAARGRQSRLRPCAPPWHRPARPRSGRRRGPAPLCRATCATGRLRRPAAMLATSRLRLAVRDPAGERASHFLSAQ